MSVYQILASFSLLWPFLRCAHKRVLNIMKVCIERNNIQIELIRFRKNRLHSRLRLRSEEFNATDVFSLGKSLQHKPVR